jgi:hypothetical protein
MPDPTLPPTLNVRSADVKKSRSAWAGSATPFLSTDSTDNCGGTGTRDALITLRAEYDLFSTGILVDATGRAPISTVIEVDSASALSRDTPYDKCPYGDRSEAPLRLEESRNAAFTSFSHEDVQV